MLTLAVLYLLLQAPAGTPPAPAPPEPPVEKVEVNVRRLGDPDAPVGMTSSVVRPGESPGLAPGLTDMAAAAPGVAENGQGGLLQTLSVRGLSRQRVLVLLDGMRLESERRAGVAAAFVDPLLLSGVDLLRGPASSLYGAGALGGVVAMLPGVAGPPWVVTGYGTQGQTRVLAGGAARGPWSVAGAVRRAGDSRTADGRRNFSRYARASAMVTGTWQPGPRRYSLLWAPSYLADVGKAATDFPGRTTLYPRERHQALRLGVTGESWKGSVWAHPHDLLTRVDRPGQQNTVLNESLDYGGAWSRDLQPAAGASLRVGADLFGRGAVNAVEAGRFDDPNLPATLERPLDGASMLEGSGFFRLSGGRRLNWETGGRFTSHRQNSGRGGSLNRSAWNGFAGLSAAVTPRVRLSGHAGTGVRFPTLTERFFSGTTGRGTVTGNPFLTAERALNLEAGLSFTSRTLALRGSLFVSDIQRFIERIEPVDGEFTFVNLGSGRMEGVEIEGAAHPSPGWELTFGGHRLRGRDERGRPLPDVPADSVWLAGSRELSRLTVGARLEVRRAKDDPGPSELRLPPALVLSASLGFPLAGGWQLELSGTNLLNRVWFPSADDLAPAAPGRAALLLLSRGR